MCRLLCKIAHYVVITGVVIGLIVSLPVAAQVTTGSISGTVTDATGAIIPGANVTIRNVGTDLTRAVNTDAAGLYTAADLDVGQYEITAQQKGFATVKKVGIDLTVGAALQRHFPYGRRYNRGSGGASHRRAGGNRHFGSGRAGGREANG